MDTELMYWETPEYRKDYTDKEREQGAKDGWAMPDGSYPCKTPDDIDNAVKAVGRGTNNSHDAIRRHIIENAQRLGVSEKIPENWNSDGSLKAEAKSAAVGDAAAAQGSEKRCPDCDGTGKVDGERCERCHGSGKLIETASSDDDEDDEEEREVIAETTVRTAAGDTDTILRATRSKKPRHRALPLVPELRFRDFQLANFEMRSLNHGELVEITGTPIVYNKPYTVRDMFGEFEETMAPGVATRLIRNNEDVRFLFNHDGLPLARSVNDRGAKPTLILEDTPTQLNFRAFFDMRQQLANDLVIAIERGDVSQMSVGFLTARDHWADDEHRTVQEFERLLDISAVTYPASPSTSLEIAQRMAMAMPLESQARVRKLAGELRSGKVLSGPNQEKVMQAAQFMHDLLDNAGVNPQDQPRSGQEPEPAQQDINDQEPDDVTDAGTSADPNAGEDGTQNSNVGQPTTSYQDGTGTRSDDTEAETTEEPESGEERTEETEEVDQTFLELELELMQLRAAGKRHQTASE